MVQKKRLLFEVSALKKNYGDNQALNIKRLEIHPGTIYGVTGSFGSGKTRLSKSLRTYATPQFPRKSGLRSSKNEKVFAPPFLRVFLLRRPPIIVHIPPL